ncbi:MAG: hypothetical protein ACRD6W_05100 [Nitrososphaerales archaeon]
MQPILQRGRKAGSTVPAVPRRQPVDAHVDLVRNDWEKDVQESVARIYVDQAGYGLIVKDAVSGHWEGNVFDALGEAVREPADRIVETLMNAFHGPYLIATDLHGDDQCPYSRGPLPLERHEVHGTFVLPKAE